MSSRQLTFGPPDSQWIYDQPTKTYYLTRGVDDSPLHIALTQGPPNTSVVIAAATTALVVVDMQNFFLHPSCRAHPTGLAAVEPLLRTIAHCRSKGVEVIWLNWGLTKGDLEVMPAGVMRGFARAMIATDSDGGNSNGNDEEEKEKEKQENKERKPLPPAVVPKSGLGVDLGEGKGRCLVEGEWNTKIYGPLTDAVREGEDIHCAKNRMSGLWCERQPLWEYLTTATNKKKRITTLLFAGVNTDQCVLGTLTDAYNAGWDCVLVEDCCATMTEGGREACLANVAVSFFCVLFFFFFFACASASLQFLFRACAFASLQRSIPYSRYPGPF